MASRRISLEFVYEGESRIYDNVDPDRYCFATLVEDVYTAFQIESSVCQYKSNWGFEINSDEDLIFLFDIFGDDVVRVVIYPIEVGVPLMAVSPDGKVLHRREPDPKKSEMLRICGGGTSGMDEDVAEEVEGGMDEDAVEEEVPVDKDVVVDGENEDDSDDSSFHLSDFEESDDSSFHLSDFDDIDDNVEGVGQKSDFQDIDPDDKNPYLEETFSVENVHLDRGERRRAKKKIKMDAIHEYGGVQYGGVIDDQFVFFVKMVFKDVEEFRNALKGYIVKNGYPIQFIKNEPARITAACTGDCPWRIHASRLSGQKVFMVKTLNDEHTCMRVSNDRLANPKWIAAQIKDLLIANPNLDNKTIRASLQSWGVDPKNWKLWRAKKLARKETQGTHIEGYRKLQKYCEMLLNLNPGSVIKLQGHPRSNMEQPLQFWRIFICLHAMKWGFMHGCRPIIGLDGCHLKGPFGGVLLSAIGIDANNGIVPIAWAVVEKENTANWLWFMELLSDCVGAHASGKVLTFMSDGQKGLGDQIEAAFPNAKHRRCCKHIVANLKDTFRGIDVSGLFWTMAYATTRAEFNKTMALLKLVQVPGKIINGQLMTPASWLQRIPPEKWSRYAFDDYVKSMDVTNNIVESFNKWILDLRDAPIVELLDKLRQQVMIRQHERFSMAENCAWHVVPAVMKQLRRLSGLCRRCKIYPARNSEFEVECEQRRFVVKLEEGTCSCNVWQISGVPCLHVVACATYLEKDPCDYVHEYFTVEMWKRTYQMCVHPIPEADLEPDEGSDFYLPPPLTRRAGRPKKLRTRHETEKPPSTRSNTVKCAVCGELGHNSRSCQGGPTKGKRKSTLQQSGRKQAHGSQVGQSYATQTAHASQQQFGGPADMSSQTCVNFEPGESNTATRGRAAKFIPKRGRGRASGSVAAGGGSGSVAAAARGRAAAGHPSSTSRGRGIAAAARGRAAAGHPPSTSGSQASSERTGRSLLFD